MEYNFTADDNTYSSKPNKKKRQESVINWNQSMSIVSKAFSKTLNKVSHEALQYLTDPVRIEIGLDNA